MKCEKGCVMPFCFRILGKLKNSIVFCFWFRPKYTKMLLLF
jgi:hypothetical protein